MESMVNPKLVQYVERALKAEYELNDPGHRWSHIEYVIRRSLGFAKNLPGVSSEMAYVIAAYHDIAHHIDYKRHELLSARRLKEDAGLRDFFSEDEIGVMADAVYDHRSTMKGDPRTVYGKIVSQADRNTSVRAALLRSYAYRVAHEPEPTVEGRIENCRKHLLKKFGRQGYARSKIYFPDPEYEKFLKEITELAEDRERFQRASREANGV